MDVKFTQGMSAYTTALQMAENAIKNPGAAEEETPKAGFDALVSEALSKAKDTGYKTEEINAKTLAGKADLQDLVVAMTNAELTLNTVVAVRDRVINAYQDILKMPI